MIVNITGGADLTLFEVDEAAERVTQVRSAKCVSCRDRLRLTSYNPTAGA